MSKYGQYLKDKPQHFKARNSPMWQDEMSEWVSVLCRNTEKDKYSVISFKSVTKSWVNVMSYQWRVSLYMVMLQNFNSHSGEGDFMLFETLCLLTTTVWMLLSITCTWTLYLRKKCICLNYMPYSTDVLLDVYPKYVSQIKGYRLWMYRQVKILRGIISQ